MIFFVLFEPKAAISDCIRLYLSFMNNDRHVTSMCVVRGRDQVSAKKEKSLVMFHHANTDWYLFDFLVLFLSFSLFVSSGDEENQLATTALKPVGLLVAWQVVGLHEPQLL